MVFCVNFVTRVALASERTCLLVQISVAGVAPTKTCDKKVSIRQGSWFSNSNLTLETIVLLTYFWVYRTEQEFVKHELGYLIKRSSIGTTFLERFVSQF